jgi:DNA-binding transcriptional MocR family regulator
LIRKTYIVTVTMWVPEIEGRTGPMYLAIADALGEDTTRGELKAGTRLPTHRELADKLGVTVGTVTRAYAEAARRGLVSGEVGRGTFARGGAPDMQPLPAQAPSERDAIDLSRNHPAPLPNAKALLAKTLQALTHRADLGELLEYAPDVGTQEHREAGAAWLALGGLTARPEDIVVTNGSQHGMTAIFAAVCRPGDLVLTEALTYPGMKAVASLLHLRLQGLPIDQNGLLPDAFEALCRSGAPRALYTIPTIQNPTTSVLPESRRKEIARIAREHGVLIVEDDVHGPLLENGPASFAELAPDVTCYLGGTAKALAPGLRISYLVAPPSLTVRIGAGIRATTWMATPLMAAIAAQWIADGTAQQLVKRRRDEARARQKIAAAQLKGFERETHPAGNHIWLHLPDPWRSETLAEAARRRGVIVTPAQAFVVGRATAPHAVRVCVAAAHDRADLEEGLGRLVRAIEGPTESGLMVM